MSFTLPDKYLAIGDPELSYEMTSFTRQSLQVIEAIKTELPPQSTWLALGSFATYVSYHSETITEQLEEVMSLFRSENELADQIKTYAAILATCDSFDEDMIDTLRYYFDDDTDSMSWLSEGKEAGMKLLGGKYQSKHPASLKDLFPVVLI